MNRCLLSGISEDVAHITADHRHREHMLRRQMEARDHNDHVAQVDSPKRDVCVVAIACGGCVSNDDARE